MRNVIDWIRRIQMRRDFYRAAVTHPGFRSHTIPPEAVSEFKAHFDFMGYSFIEMFFVEDWPSLRRSLSTLFPSASPDILPDASLASSYASTWSRIGRIQRENIYPSLGHLRTMPELPNEVRYIDVLLSVPTQNCPVALLSFDVAYNESVTDRVTDLLGRTFEANPIISKWGAKGSVGFRNPEIDQMESIAKYLEFVQRRVETVITRHIRDGYFSSANSSYPRLNIFVSNDLPPTPDREWLLRTRSWRTAIELNLDFNGLGGGEAVILLPASRNWSKSHSPWALILRPSESVYRAYSDGRFAALQHLTPELTGFRALISFDHFEVLQRQLVAEIRANLRKATRTRPWFLFRLLDESSLLFKVVADLDIITRLRPMLEDLASLQGRFLNSFNSSYQLNAQDGMESGWFNSQLLERVERLQTDLTVAQAYLRDSLSIRNVLAVLAVALLSLVASVVSLLISFGIFHR